MADARGPSSKIEIRVLYAKDTATIRETIGQADLAEAMGRIFRAVSEVLAKQGVKPSGSPFARYHSFGETVDLEVGMPVSSPIQPDGKVTPSKLPAGPVAIAVHAGPYESLSQTYDAVESWIRSSGRTPTGGPWEIYLTDPSSEPNPAKWLTEILWPVSNA